MRPTRTRFDKARRDSGSAPAIDFATGMGRFDAWLAREYGP